MRAVVVVGVIWCWPFRLRRRRTVILIDPFLDWPWTIENYIVNTAAWPWVLRSLLQGATNNVTESLHELMVPQLSIATLACLHPPKRKIVLGSVVPRALYSLSLIAYATTQIEGCIAAAII